MTEAELFEGVTDALTIAGWRWMHILRSDGVTVGASGFPDVIAVHPTRGQVLALELKGDNGIPTIEQLAWIRGFNGQPVRAQIVWPKDYDEILSAILPPA